MGQTVADFLLPACASGGSSRSSAIPATASTGSSPHSARPTTSRSSSRRATRRWRRSHATGYAKFSGEVGVCMATSGPGAIHLLNGLYDAKLDHMPVVAIVGQTARSAMGGSYQQEVDLQALFKDVASDYLVEVNVAEPAAQRARPGASASRGATGADRGGDPVATCRRRTTSRRPTPSSRCRQVGRRYDVARRWPPIDERSRAPPRSSTPASKVAILIGQGARGAAAEMHAGSRADRRRRRQGAAGQGRAARRSALRDRRDRTARHQAQL